MKKLTVVFCLLFIYFTPMHSQDFGNFLLQTGTAMIETDQNYAFAVADYNRDGVPDVYIFKKSQTGTKSTEVHILNGASGYKAFLLQTGTAMNELTDQNNEFAVADYNKDGVPDVYIFLKSQTGTKSTEVHILNGASGYKTFLLQTGTAIIETDQNYAFAVADYNRDGVQDVYIFKRSQTGTKSTEVHILNGASGYKTFLLQTGTAMIETDQNYAFAVADYNRDGVPDVYIFKKSQTGTKSTEVHILNGASGYKTFLLQTGTAMIETDQNYAFAVADYNKDGVPDVYIFKKSQTGTKSTEVHILGAKPQAGANSSKLIYLSGSSQGLTGDQLKAELGKKGLTLVQTDELQPNQCAVIYSRVDKNDLSANFGCLVCATQIGEHVTLNSAAVYGGCDASDPTSQGLGAKCEVGVLSQELKVKLPGGSTKFAVKGPSANACGSISTDRLCANAGASIASTSISITDDHGTGIGVGLEAGVGAGLNGGYEDGVASFGVNLKFLAGASITFSVNVKDVGEKILNGSVTSVIYVNNQIVAVGDQIGKVYKNVSSEVIKNKDVVVMTFQQTGKDTYYYFDNLSNDVKKDFNSFFDYTGKELSSWANNIVEVFKGAKLSRKLRPGEGYLSVFNQAGYVTLVNVTYDHLGQKQSFEKKLSAGYTSQFFLPPGSRNIRLQVNGVATADKDHLDVTFPVSTNLSKAYKFWGTIFDVSYGEVTP